MFILSQSPLNILYLSILCFYSWNQDKIVSNHKKDVGARTEQMQMMWVSKATH